MQRARARARTRVQVSVAGTVEGKTASKRRTAGVAI
jgi:hypothetical protein